MGIGNFTKQGMRQLADLLEAAMEEAEVSYPDLVAALDKIGHKTNIPRIQRLREGVNKEPPAGLLWAISKLGIIKAPDGHPYSLEELLAIACEMLDPVTGKFFDNSGPGPNPGQEEVKTYDSPFVAFLRAEMAGKDKATFARQLDISLKDLEELLGGKLPSWLELLKLGAYFYPDTKDPTPIAHLLGINLNTPIQAQNNGNPQEHVANGC